MCWDEVFRTLYREKTEKFGWEKTQRNKTTEEIWKRLKEITKEPIIYKEKKIIKKQIGHKDWWDRQCTRKKRKVKRIYVKWKKGKGMEKRYVEERKSFRIFLEEKRKKKREEEEKKLKNIQNSAQIWEYINKKRNKREWRENNIRKEEWRKYFMELLEEMEQDGEQNQTINEQTQEVDVVGAVEGKEPGDDEIGKAVLNLRLGKAVRKDGIPMKAWRYGGMAIKKGLTEIIRNYKRFGQAVTYQRIGSRV